RRAVLDGVALPALVADLPGDAVRALRGSRTAKFALEAGATALIVALLWLFTTQSDSIFVPALPDVFTSFKDVWLFASVESDLVPSLKRLALGLLLATVLGVGL